MLLNYGCDKDSLKSNLTFHFYDIIGHQTQILSQKNTVSNMH